ncbi:TPA: thioredoxin domain-containing protein [Enterobacter kobei]|nr:thioredoxin domain-containing protein [Enterobacter kobei]
MLVTGVCASVPALAEGQPAVSASAKTTTASASVSAHPAASAAPVASGVFTPEQEARIGEIAKDYLLAHPDVLVEVSQKLEAQQQEAQRVAMTQAVLRHQDALLDDKSTPSYGPADAKVAFIGFFDYQCSVCARQAPVIESLMKANPQVRYVFKEWPIFAHRWTPSLTAAKTGLQVWQQKGADAYLAYHNALYATGHDEGRLTQADINRAASQAGKLKGKSDEMLAVLSRTDALAQNLGLRGTPGMIVMPVNGASADNVTVIPGGADQSTLQAAIDKAAGQPGE